MEIKTPSPVDVLALGSGWTWTFLKKELDDRKVSCTSTTRDGSDDTIPFAFDPASTDAKPYARLPQAKTVVIIFPLVTKGAHELLIKLYNQTHPDSKTQTRWIQLGSTSAFDAPGEPQSVLPLWRDRHSKVDTAKARVMTEEELLALADTTACVLNLAGLWGGSRDMRNYVNRVAATKSALAAKGSLHMIHGIDVARSIATVHENFTPGRWLLTDMRVYDWWDLISAWGARQEGTATKEHAEWVRELAVECGVKALPRAPEQMGGKALDSREFWEAHKELGGPLIARLEKE